MPPIAILVALADPTRCRILELLRDGPQPVHILAASFDISRPAISRHLRVLKQAGLIREKKAGRENRYGLNAKHLTPARTWLEGFMTPSDPVAPPIAPPVTPEAPAPSRPRKQSAVSQMGFDF